MSSNEIVSGDGDDVVQQAEIAPGLYTVAGAAGLMGTAALRRLHGAPGVSVRAVYHRRRPVIEVDTIEPVQADLRDEEACRSVCAGADYVFMFAGILSTAAVLARDPVAHIVDNVAMTTRMMQAAYESRVKRFVWLSSSTGYPQQESPLTEDDMFRADPPAGYFAVGWYSRYIEKLAQHYAQHVPHPLQVVMLRPTTIYGEYESFDLDECHMLPALVRKTIERMNPLEVWGDGEQRRDLIYADDVLTACLLAMQRSEPYQVYNVGAGAQYRIKDLLRTIIEQDGFANAQVEYRMDRPSAPVRRELDLTRSRAVLGFRPQTSIEDGIRRMIHRCRQLYGVPVLEEAQ